MAKIFHPTPRDGCTDAPPASIAQRFLSKEKRSMLSLFDLFERVSSGSVREAKVSMVFEICEVEQIPYPYHVSYIYIILLILIP